MMIATCTIIGTIDARCTIRLTGNASVLFGIFVVTIWTLLYANGQIRDSQMSWSAFQTRILSWSCACFARFVTRPTSSSLTWKTSRRTPAHASVVQLIMFTTDALRGSFTVATLRIAFRIAIIVKEYFYSTFIISINQIVLKIVEFFVW